LEIWIPYGETEVRVGVRTENLVGIAQPKDIFTILNPKLALAETISNIRGGHSLDRVLSHDDKVVLTVDLPPTNKYFELIDLLLFEILNLVDINRISVLWVQNDGWPPVQNGLKSDVKNFTVLNHTKPELTTAKECVEKNLMVCKEFNEASLRILVGKVGFDPVWGYTGGVKTILSLMNTQARTEFYRRLVLAQIENGSSDLDNAKDLESILSPDGSSLMLSVVESIDGGIAGIFSGTFDESFRLSKEFIDEHCRIGLDKGVDILIVGAGGRPYDYTLFSSLDSAIMNTGVLKRGGVLILVAECMGGCGSDVFREWMFKGWDPEKLKSMLKRNFEIGAEKAYLLTKLLEEFRLYLVSVMPDYYVKNIFRLKSSRTVNDALQHALRILGRESEIAVAPYGSLTQTFIKPRS
jgi:nickel-dependent lactate racemase